MEENEPSLEELSNKIDESYRNMSIFGKAIFFLATPLIVVVFIVLILYGLFMYIVTDKQ